MKIKLYIYLVQVLILLGGNFSGIIAKNFNFSYFNVQEGLPQSLVNFIYNDSRGYLWVATSGGGVAQFDGKKFVTYSEKEGLAGNIVTGIAEDKEGNMWFTSTWGGITRFNGKKMDVYSVKNGLYTASNSSIFIDNKNRKWIGSDSGLTILENDVFTKATSPFLTKSINFIKCGLNNNILIGTKEGLVLISESDTLFFNTSNNLPANNITAASLDRFGNYYVGFDQKGIYKIIKGSLSKNAQLTIIPIKENISISSIEIDNDKNIWFSSFDKGLYYTNSTTNEVVQIVKNDGLKTNLISQLYKDRVNNLWIGSIGMGLIRLNTIAFSYFDQIEGFNKNNVFGIINDETNNIWAVTSDDGVFMYDGNDVTHFTIEQGLGSNNVTGLAKSKNETLWFATDKGLTKFKNNVFTNYTIEDGLPMNNTTSLVVDKNENVWIGTNGGGLVKFEKNKFKTFTFNQGIANNIINSLFEDSKGNIWVGTENGINKIVNDIVVSFPTKNLCNPNINGITEDKYGNIWFGTDRCLTKYDGKNFTILTTKNGLSSNSIYIVHYSKRGSLWVGTNKGLDKISLGSNNKIIDIKNYNYLDGFKGIECNKGAIYEDEKDNLWIGTVNGVIKYQPQKDRKNVFESKTHITNVKLFLEEVNWLNYTTDIIKWYNLPLSLSLPYNENHLTFEFNSINLIQPAGISYCFYLDGFDKEWSVASTKDFVTYSNLPPGKYIFKVKSRNNDGIWNQESANFSFTIISPYWKTWWFYILVTLLIFYIILKILSFRDQKQLEISKELEEKVRERTLIIEKQRDEKEILLKEIHHRVKNNMQIINSLLSIQSNFTNDENITSLFKEAQNRVRSMALIHEKMYQSKDLSHIDFKEYITDLSNDLISTYILFKEIKLDLKIEPLKFGVDTLIPIGLLINEIISNSLKYAFESMDKGIISIHIYKINDKTFKLLIGDNGIGMEKIILNEDEQKEETLGIELIKVFVSQLDGQITRLDKKGTYYEIIFHMLTKH